MYLTIEGESRSLIPIKDFRAAQGLPPDFGVAFFEPKDYDGLGRIDRAGLELNRVRAALLDALPQRMDKGGWLAFLPDYARLFEDQLYTINDHIGLKDVEIEFAVAGLSDVLHHLAYKMMLTQFTPPPLIQIPLFSARYTANGWITVSRCSARFTVTSIRGRRGRCKSSPTPMVAPVWSSTQAMKLFMSMTRRWAAPPKALWQPSYPTLPPAC